MGWAYLPSSLAGTLPSLPPTHLADELADLALVPGQHAIPPALRWLVIYQKYNSQPAKDSC